MSNDLIDDYTPLPFCAKLRFREELKDGDSKQRNAYTSWRSELEGKDWYLIGQSESAYAIVDKPGNYGFNYISGDPSYLFDVVEDSL